MTVLASDCLCFLSSQIHLPQSHKRALTPYVWLNFLSRVKVFCNEHPPWSKLQLADEAHLWSFEKHSLKCYLYKTKNFVLNFTEDYYTR